MVTYRQPFRGEWPISQGYGEVIPGVTFNGKPHTGIDYACPAGTEIFASADGVVMFAGWDNTGYGNVIIILHQAKKATLYAHLNKCMVFTNQKVKQGDVIGLSGATGGTSAYPVTGPHLHFEARKVWNNYSTHQDPVTYLPLMSMIDLPLDPEPASNTERIPIKAGTVRVVCDLANVRDPANHSYIRGQKKHGETFEVTDGTVEINGLPYRRIIPRHVEDLGGLIAEYDSFGTQILEQVT